MRRSIANILRLGIKELQSLARDPVLVFLIVWAFSALVYSVSQAEKFEVDRGSIAIVDDDRSALSGAITDAIQPPFFQPPALIDAANLDPLMDSGRFVFVVEFPPRFQADVLAGRKPTVQITVDATAMSQAGNGAVFLREIVTREVARFLSDAPTAKTPPFRVAVRTRFNPNAEAIWYSSAMTVINSITLLSVILCGAALIREREHGTIEHLLVMPVSPTDIMLSKILANGLVIVVAALLSFTVVVGWLMQVPISGSIALFLLGAVAYQFSVNALGILLATFTTSMQQFGLLVIPILITMNLLSGSKTPLESMPVWLQTLMQAAPSTHFVAFSQSVLFRDAGFAEVWPKLAALVAVGAVFFLVALLRFRQSVTRAQ